MLRFFFPFFFLLTILQVSNHNFNVDGFSIPSSFSVHNDKSSSTCLLSRQKVLSGPNAKILGMHSLYDSTALDHRTKYMKTKLNKSYGNSENKYSRMEERASFELKRYSGATDGASLEKPNESNMNARLKVGAFFSLWYILNIGYNIYNKRILNAIPLPWTIGAIQLWVGLLYFVPLWITGIRKTPILSQDNVKNLLPVAFMHTAAHITAVISLGKSFAFHLLRPSRFVFFFFFLFFKCFFTPCY